jgi:hypothetical protein
MTYFRPQDMMSDSEKATLVLMKHFPFLNLDNLDNIFAGYIET